MIYISLQAGAILQSLKLVFSEEIFFENNSGVKSFDEGICMQDFLNVSHIYKGIVLPYKKNQSWGAGGVISEEGEFVQESMYTDWMTFGGLYSYDESKVKSEEGNAIWMGKFNEHWGHFLLDDISRLWYVLENYNDEKIIYVSENDVLSGNYEIFLTSLGIPREKLFRVKDVTRFDEIIIPQCSKVSGKIHSDYKMIFSKVIDALMDKGEVGGYDKVYLSRQNFAGACKKEIGEKEIEEYLNSKGYISISPESTSLKEQVIIWNTSTSIACFNGTIPLNLLFMKDRNLKLILINKTSRPHKNLDDVLSLFNKLSLKSIDVYSKFYDKHVRYLGEGPFILNNKSELISYFDHGIVPSTSFSCGFKLSHFMFFAIFTLKRFLKGRLKSAYHILLKIKKT